MKSSNKTIQHNLNDLKNKILSEKGIISSLNLSKSTILDNYKKLTENYALLYQRVEDHLKDDTENNEDEYSQKLQLNEENNKEEDQIED